MKKIGRKKIILTTLILSLIFIMMSPNILKYVDEINQDWVNKNLFEKPKISGYYSESFVYINGNWSTATSYDWCHGDGSWGNPYVIENLTIDPSGSPIESGIYIKNSNNVYFIIRNCNITNTGGSGLDAGIKLENTSNGTLINNNCSDNFDNGIILYQNSLNNTIKKNLLVNNGGKGIYLETGCNRNTISENIITESNSHGIYLKNECVNNSILENNIANTYFGVGIFLESQCSMNNLTGNQVNSGWNVGIFLSNKCNENILYRNFASNNDYGGISISSESNHNLILNNTLKENWDLGLLLSQECVGNKIIGNNITSNTLSGMRIYNSCYGNIIKNNILEDNTEKGILVHYSCNWNDISGNKVRKNGQHGIYLYESCYGNILSKNKVKNNGLDGIYLDVNCSESNIHDNIISDNDQIGVSLGEDCDGSIIYKNLSFNNTEGLNLYKSDNNLVYHNFFFNNTNENTQDNSGLNTWDNGTLGNLWNDYTGSDVDNDGVGDTPYQIPGTSMATDNYPIMNLNPHFVNRPSDGNFELDSQNKNISWSLIHTSSTSLNFYIYKDGLLIENDRLDPFFNNISIMVDTSSIGLYNYTLKVENDQGGLYTDTVLVKIFTCVSVNYSIDIDIIEQRYTENDFNLTFYVYNSSNPNQGIEWAQITSWTIWWNETDVSGDIVAINNGYYKISLEPITVAPEGDPICLNGTILADQFQEKQFEFLIAVKPEDTSTSVNYSINIDIIEQRYTENDFNLTFYVYNSSNPNQGIEWAQITSWTIWWNETDVSGDIVALNKGYYKISLEPITVTPEEDAICLNGTILADQFQEKQFEFLIAVDPEVIDDNSTPSSDEDLTSDGDDDDGGSDDSGEDGGSNEGNDNEGGTSISSFNPLLVSIISISAILALIGCFHCFNKFKLR